MSHDRREERVDRVRRKLLRASAVAGGALALGHLPYERPAWKSFFGVRSAWAQPTSFLQHVLEGQLGTEPPGTPDDTGQDCWEIPSGANNEWTITATPDANLDIEIYLYAAGAVGAGETNLLTGNPFGLDANGVGGVESATIALPDPGPYTICIEDSRTVGNQVAGLYTIVVESTRPMGPAVMTVDEGPESDGPEG